MVSAAFLAIPSLWGIQSATISGSPFALQVFKIKTNSAGTKFLHAANVNNFQNVFDPDFNNKEWGSLGDYTYHQVQIESLSATQRNVTIKFEFGEQKNGVNNSAMEKILFLNETYLNHSTLDSTVTSKGNF